MAYRDQRRGPGQRPPQQRHRAAAMRDGDVGPERPQALAGPPCRRQVIVTAVAHRHDFDARRNQPRVLRMGTAQQHQHPVPLPGQQTTVIADNLPAPAGGITQHAVYNVHFKPFWNPGRNPPGPSGRPAILYVPAMGVKRKLTE